MDKTELLSTLLNGQTKEQYISFLIYGILGFIASILVQLIKSRKKIKEKGGFSFSYWFLDNWLRGVLSLLCIFIGVLYAPEIGNFVGMNLELSNKGALITGFFTDKIVEVLVTFDFIKFIT